MTSPIKLLSFLLFFIFLVPIAQAQKVSDGKTLYEYCVACHGEKAEGSTLVQAPALAGQEVWYIEKQLHKFRDGIRGAHADDVAGLKMRPMSRTLPDEAAVKAVAEYINKLPAHKPAATLAGDATKGKTAYGTCIACHGPKAEGNAALKAPKLTGLNDWYLLTQIKNFKAGIRGTHPKDIEGMQMRPMAMSLATDQAILDVIAYIRSLQ